MSCCGCGCFLSIAVEGRHYISFRQILDNIMDESDWINSGKMAKSKCKGTVREAY